MNTLPITFCLFGSTKGHFGRKTDYKTTLDHWNRQVPLSLFNLIAHLKVTPGDEQLAVDMKDDLERRGFRVLTTTAAWTRGLSHGAAYLSDAVTVSKDPAVYTRSYFLWAEDDSPLVPHRLSVEDLLLQSCQLLADSHEVLSARVMRRGDTLFPVDDQPVGPAGFWSKNFDFQPSIMRSIDFYRVGIILEANPQACNQVQCEMLWRIAMDGFSRSPRKHWVYDPVTEAETIHLGVPSPDHEAALQRLASS